MTDQLISFETAKLLKQKGFGGEGYTTDYSYQFHSSNPEIGYFLCKMPENNKSVFNGTKCIMENGKEGYSATTQTYLQKWLREKHNINVLIQESNVFGKYRCMYANINRIRDISTYTYYTINYDIYEEALEDGLIKALKLIP